MIDDDECASVAITVVNSAAPRSAGLPGRAPRGQHQDRGVTLGGAVGLGRHRVDDEAMPILDEEMPEVRQSRLPIRRLAIHLGVRVAGRGVCVVRTRLAVEITAITGGGVA